jgi:predicted RNase H-like HicB family nuclease
MHQTQATLRITVDIEKESLSSGEPVYVATCRELDLASQGPSIEVAIANVRGALILWLETASSSEIDLRLSGVVGEPHEVYTTRIEVPYATPEGAVRS